MASYEVRDTNRFDPADVVVVIGTSSLALSMKSAAKYVDSAPKWKNAPKIYVKVNGIHPFRTSAAALKARPRKVLVSSFGRQITIHRLA